MDLDSAPGIRVAISGASSFTGFWIARAFAERGFAVDALCPGRPGDYRGRKRQLLTALEGRVRVHYGLRAQDGGLADWLLAHGPQLFVHHHHFMGGYRGGDYDLAHARRVGVAPLPGLVQALARAGARGILHTGSYFEPGEGGQSEDAPVLPYAACKREVWLALCACAERAGLPVSKLVMPNAIGPGEAGGRLIPSLLDAARRGCEFPLHRPHAVSDDVPVTALARRYTEVALELLAGREQTARPSGAVQCVRDCARLVGRELLAGRLGLAPPLLVEGSDTEAPRFANPPAERIPIDWPAFWDLYARWSAKGVPQKREESADRELSI